VGLKRNILKRVVCLQKADKQHLFTLEEATDMQAKTLRYLIRRAKITAFGDHYQFPEIAESKEYLNLFRNRVPIHTYNDMYVRWWYRSLNGETYVTWPGKIKYYLTKDIHQQITGKTIPVSRAILRSYLVAGERYYSMCDSDKLNVKSVGSPPLDNYKTYYGGTLAAILSHHNPLRYKWCLENCFVYENTNREKDFLLTDVGLVGLRYGEHGNFRLIVDNSLFYEFLPMKISSKPDKEFIKSETKHTITLHEIEEDKDYILLLTNNSGAWRYFTGQIVRFTNREHLEFMVLGKVKVSK